MNVKPRPAEPAPLKVLAPSRFRPGVGQLRLQTLTRLRWLAVGGQAATVLGVQYGLGFQFDAGPCLAIIAVSAWLNIFLRLRFKANLRLANNHAALLLAFDIVQLACLMYLTGGLENPFSFLFLAPTTISAANLLPRHTFMLGGLAAVCVSILARFHRPLPWYPGRPLDLPELYVLGVWVALMCALAFMGIYAWRIARDSRHMSQALAAAELVLARDQQLSALDGLAAAAAHELGTPLATIALVVKELARDKEAAARLGDDLALLQSQTARCRDILSRLAAYQGQSDTILDRAPFSAVMKEAAEAQGPARSKIEVTTTGAGGREPVILRIPALIHGLSNLIENADEFAETTVSIDLAWDDARLSVSIEDDGPGFAIDILNRLGEPYVTTRPRTDSPPADDHDVSAHGIGEGMGLGFFIAKTLLERTGATLTLANRTAPHHGAIVRAEWPRTALEAV